MGVIIDSLKYRRVVLDAVGHVQNLDVETVLYYDYFLVHFMDSSKFYLQLGIIVFPKPQLSIYKYLFFGLETSDFYVQHRIRSCHVLGAHGIMRRRLI